MMLCILREKRAQATVEMAVVAPVMIILALIVYNLMQFACAVARFDRVAPDIVLAQGGLPKAMPPWVKPRRWNLHCKRRWALIRCRWR